jgi:TorA maturation chaperone TorD
MRAEVDAASGEPEAGPAAILDHFRRLVAEDLLFLALLHHAEPSGERLESLRRDAGTLALGLELRSATGQEALRALAAALASLPATLDQAVLDQLAADYADIYLTHGYGASPHESVWLDEDHLMRQEPMFQVRAWYARHGLTAGDGRTRPDDHLALELQFLAHLFAPERGDTLAEAARFIDEHLLRWLPRFARRVAERCRTLFFAALALLTDAYCEELQDLLALILAEPRPHPRRNRTADETGALYPTGSLLLRPRTGTDVVDF